MVQADSAIVWNTTIQNQIRATKIWREGTFRRSLKEILDELDGSKKNLKDEDNTTTSTFTTTTKKGSEKEKAQERKPLEISRRVRQKGKLAVSVGFYILKP